MNPKQFHHALLRAYLTPMGQPDSVTVSLSHWEGFKEYWCGERGVKVTHREDGSIESPFEGGKLFFIQGLPDDLVIVPGVGVPLSQFMK